MKNRIFPVIITAALTSVMTFFLAAHYSPNIPFLTGNRPQLPVNYASYNEGNNIIKSNGVGAVDFQDAAAASVKAVVHIKITTKARTVVQQNPLAQLFGDDVFGSRQVVEPPQMGSGSGVVISPDGYIVTNNHVVAGADELTVTFNDRYTTKAKVIATDPSTDIALVKVEEKNLPYMEFGNSDNVRVGQWVLAVGYPLSLDATVTAGIVSAKGRSIGINRTNATNPIESFIQTDAAVNPGNSGGALVNTSGQLIGINSAIASLTGTYVGYSYAVPANLVHKVVNDLMKYGSVQRGYLGIGLLDSRHMTPEQLTQLGIDKADGVYVANVIPNSGAAQAGLAKGDFITQINGTAVQTEPEMLEQIARYKPGDNISITYVRSGNVNHTTVQLKNMNGNTAIIKDQNATRLLGANFRSLTNAEKNKYGIDGGVAVTNVGKGTIGKQTTMKNGFVIISVNENAVTSVQDLQQVLASNSNKAQLAGFYPGNDNLYYYVLSNISDQLLHEE
ncbi:MAG: trypsin-like peptidase domain-containing protein [Taibaiella sp.]|nr:trypsin-like peptidase domain-containing protein [Taibaiella sp.]